MKARNNWLFALAFATLVAILGGCVSGATVRNDTGGGGVIPTPTPPVPPAPTGVPGTGSATTIVTGPTNCFDIAQDDTYIYYTIHVANNGSVLAVPKSSTGNVAPIVLASGGNANTPWGVTCDPGTTGYVYYTDFLPIPQGTVYRVPKPVGGVAGGQPSIIATGLDRPTFIRLNDVVGGDGLLYTCENTATDARVLRFNTTTLNQTRNNGTFINIGANTQPPFNLHLFSVGGAAQLWFTQMASDMTTGNSGQVRYITTNTTGPVNITSTTLVGTGLLNPTDLWLWQSAPTSVNVLWTEFDQSAGGVRSASINDFSVRGTTIASASTNASSQPPAAIKINQAASLAYVTRNAQEVNGGGFVIFDLAQNKSTALTLQTPAGVTGAVNYPFQFIGDLTYGLFATEFNFTQGESLSTNPSNVVRLGFPVTFAKRASAPEEHFVFNNGK